MTADAGPQTDEALVRRAVDGDRRAFDALFRRHAPTLGRRLQRILFRSNESQDVLQATFVEVWRTLARFKPEAASFEAWLNAVAYRVVGNHLKARRRKWWQFLTSWDEPEAPQPAEVPAHGSQVESRQLLEQLYAVLEELPAKKRIAFALYEFDGLSLKEIGEMVGASPQTVWARVESARGELKQRLGYGSEP